MISFSKWSSSVVITHPWGPFRRNNLIGEKIPKWEYKSLRYLTPERDWLQWFKFHFHPNSNIVVCAKIINQLTKCLISPKDFSIFSDQICTFYISLTPTSFPSPLHSTLQHFSIGDALVSMGRWDSSSVFT